MNKITIEKAGTVETLTIPDDAIDAVMAELTERFGKRYGFVKRQKCWVIAGSDIIERPFDDDDYDRFMASIGLICHTKAEAESNIERFQAEQRLRKAYLAVTGGAEIEEFVYVPFLDGDVWRPVERDKGGEPHPYRFATAEQAAAFGRDNGDDLIRMMSV